MRPPVEIFDEWLRVVGLKPRFHPIPAELTEAFAHQLLEFERRMSGIRPLFRENRGIDVYADFIDDGTCNGFAGVHDGLGVVAIPKGTVLLPVEIFYRMFSHPLVLIELGNSMEEQIGPQHREGLPGDYDELIALRRRENRTVLPRIPANSERMKLAHLCAQVTWRFIVMHEISHVVHGHVQYLQSVQGVPFMSEVFGAISPSRVSRTELDRQTMELWADAMAAKVVLAGLLTQSPRVAELLQDTRERLFIWSFAMFALFRLWGLEIDPSDLKGRHPPNAMRYSLLMTGPCYDIAAPIPELRDQYWSIVTAGQREAERAIVLVGEAELLPQDVLGIPTHWSRHTWTGWPHTSMTCLVPR
jgi:hypothetical protein